MTLAGPRVLGRYELYDPIAAGGTATVHLGRAAGSVGFARVVAIKRMHAHYASDARFVSTFLDEGRLAARVRHLNVVPVLDVVAEGENLIQVLEYVPGVAIDQLLRAGSALRPDVAVTLALDLLRGLHAAHEVRGVLEIVHRDVSRSRRLPRRRSYTIPA